MVQTTFNQRFKVLIEFYKLRNADVARKMKVDRQLIANYQHKTQPTVEKIALMIETFPDVNLEWLVLGTGNMLKNEMPDHGFVAEQAGEYQTIDKYLMRKLWEQDRAELVRLRELNQQLTQKLLSLPDNNKQSKIA